MLVGKLIKMLKFFVFFWKAPRFKIFEVRKLAAQVAKIHIQAR